MSLIRSIISLFQDPPGPEMAARIRQQIGAQNMRNLTSEHLYINAPKIRDGSLRPDLKLSQKLDA